MSDITLDSLFRASQSVELPDGVVVQVRALGDAERRSRTMASLRASIRLDEKLEDTNSDEYMVYLLPLKKSSRDELLEIVQTWRENEASRTATDEVPDEYIPFPTNASDEEMKAVLLKRNVSEKDIQKRREDYVKKQGKLLRKTAEKWDDDKLLQEAIARKKTLIALNETVNENAYQSVFIATEKDGKRYFNSIEDVRGMNSDVLVRLFVAQQEVDSLDTWELTKIRAGRESKRLVAPDEELLSEAELESMVVDVGREPFDED